MTNDLDPTVLQLFAEKQRPIDAGQFIVQIAARLEHEERRQRWLRRVALAAALLLSALGMPWMMRAAALVARDLALDAPGAAWDAGLDPQWLPLALLCGMALGLVSLWRLLRRAS